jgi:hypothetical protein
MHGHGVNLRHIGLLRSLLLKEVVDAAVDAARSKSVVSAAGSDSRPDSLNISQDSYDGHHHITSKDAPLDIDIDMDMCMDITDPLDRRDRGSRNQTETGTPSGAPAGLTPALYALQSELFLEALCRTLKVVRTSDLLCCLIFLSTYMPIM